MLVKALFRDAELNVEDIEGIVLSSVVPPVVFPLENMCVRYFNRRPFVIGPELRYDLDLKVDNPREVGADRIVNAVAATVKYDGPLIIVDFGTETTYCYIDAQKRYYGGIISPGVMVSTEALYNKGRNYRGLRLPNRSRRSAARRYMRCSPERISDTSRKSMDSSIG